MRTSIKSLMIISIVIFSSTLFAAERKIENGGQNGTLNETLNGTSVMEKVLLSFYYQGNDQSANAHMAIIDKQGRKRIREFNILRLNIDHGAGKQKYYVYFKKPSDVKKLTFMAWKNVTQDDDRWLYLPALDLVKRIAASDERTSFVGSHFYYEDVSGRSLSEDSHKLVEETDTFYKLESTPNNTESVLFSHYQTWVDKKTFLPIKINYYQNDLLYRQYQTLKTAEIQGHATIVKAQMEDKRSAGKTVIEYSAVKYDRNIPEKIFSERFLRKAPKKYLK